ncbi:MAG: terpene cyclase/mutase family protein, partial [Kiritimatiellae bacterium]|nr:terpene cyclase/mutase family protein [Kiritimatiellia bacterium]
SELSNVPAGRECVRRGVEYLLGSQSATGEFGPSFGGGAYNHALATLALLHVFEMDRDERLRRALDRALHVILGRQTRKGGWGYWGEPEGEPNLSVTMWQLEALRLAESLGWPDVHDNVRRGVLWVASVADDRGLFGYRSAADFPPGGQSLTLMGALALMSGTESVLPSGQMQRVRQRIREAAVQTGGEPDFYHAYFLAAVIKKMEDEAASRAFAGIRRNILASQRRQGANSGSWDPDRRWGNVGGRIYATAMASLSLR